MPKLLNAFSLFFIGVYATTALAVGIHIRGLPTFSDEYQIEKIDPRVPRQCFAWMSKIDSFKNELQNLLKLDQRVEKAISKSNDIFKERREWDDDAFLSSRFEIAEKFGTRSHYVLITHKKTGEIVGGIAMTTAIYDKDSLPDPTQPVSESSEHLEFLPEEESLGIFPLERPLGPSGKGVIIEFRTFFIDKAFRKDIRVALFGQILEMAYMALNENNHNFAYVGVDQDAEFLWRQPIIKIYNDEPGLDLYREFGFVPASENGQNIPVRKYDANWWTLNVSPENLEKHLTTLALANARQFSVKQVREPTTFEITKGRQVMIRAMSSLYVDRVHDNYTFNPEDNYDLGHSLAGAAGSKIIIKNNEPSYIGFLANDAVVDGHHLKAGAEVWFKPGLKIDKVFYPFRLIEDFHEYLQVWTGDLTSRIGGAFSADLSDVNSVEITEVTHRDFHINGGPIIITAGSRMRWDGDSLAIHTFTNQDRNWSPFPGLLVKRGEFISLDEKNGRKIEVGRLAHSYEVLPGVQTMQDEPFSFWFGDNNQVIWATIYLESDAVIQGLHYPRGTYLTRQYPGGPIEASDHWVEHYSRFSDHNWTPR